MLFITEYVVHSYLEDINQSDVIFVRDPTLIF